MNCNCSRNGFFDARARSRRIQRSRRSSANPQNRFRFGMKIWCFRILSLILLFGEYVAEPACAADWPTWRGDAGRSGATHQKLPDELNLHWVLELPEPRPAWPASQVRLQFDRAYEPVVAGRANVRRIDRGRLRSGLRRRQRKRTVAVCDRRPGSVRSRGSKRTSLRRQRRRASVLSVRGKRRTAVEDSRRAGGSADHWQRSLDFHVARAGRTGHCRQQGLLCGRHLAVDGNFCARRGRGNGRRHLDQQHAGQPLRRSSARRAGVWIGGAAGSAGGVGRFADCAGRTFRAGRVVTG